jgi:NAD(P)-dependent dehydrogenase (short-subunit alcohol dehydrogenase family)
MLQCNDVTKKTFEGKSVLLTGASRLGWTRKGIGLAVCRECQVHNLVLNGRNQDALPPKVLAQ